MLKEEFRKQFNKVVEYVQFWQHNQGFINHDHYYDILRLAGEIRGEKYHSGKLDHHTKNDLIELQNKLFAVCAELKSQKTEGGELVEQIEMFLYFFTKDIDRKNYANADIRQKIINSEYYCATLLCEALEQECPEIKALGNDSGLMIE